MKDFRGPWKACLNVRTAAIPGHLIKVDDDVQFVVASVWKGGTPKCEKMMIKIAHLISAAPELLDALKQVTACLESYVDSSSSEYGFLKRARAAIAKAEGKAVKRKQPPTTANNRKPSSTKP